MTAFDLDIVLNSVTRGLTKSISDLRALKKEADLARRSVASIGSGAASSTAAASSISSLSTAARSACVSTKALTKDSDALRRTTEATTRSTDGFIRSLTGVNLNIGDAAVRFFTYSVALRGVTTGFSNATSDALKFERELVRIAQLSNRPINAARELGTEITRLSGRFGVSSNELLRAAQTFTQAGRSIDETRQALNALAPTTLSANFGDAASTTKNLLATLKQFRLELGQSTQIFDSFNAIAKETDVSVQELFEGLRRGGTIFSSLSGVQNNQIGSQENLNSLRQFASIFASVISTTRESAETIGTSLRTIIPRLTRTETLDRLEEVGISLRDSQRNFVGPAEALQRLANAIGDQRFQDPAVISILEELGGTRQIGRTVAAITGAAEATRLFNIARNSQGSLAEDVGKAEENLQVRLDQLRQSFNALTRDILNSQSFQDLAKTLIEVAQGAISVARSISQVIDSLGPIVPLLASVAAFRGIGAVGRGLGFFNDGGRANSRAVALTRGEVAISPEAQGQFGGASRLLAFNRRFNAGGRVGPGMTELRRGVSLVTSGSNANVDSVLTNVPEGTVILNRDASSAFLSGQGPIAFANRGGQIGRGKRRGFMPGGIVTSPDVGLINSLRGFNDRLASIARESVRIQIQAGTDIAEAYRRSADVIRTSANQAQAATRLQAQSAEILRGGPPRDPTIPPIASGSNPVPVTITGVRGGGGSPTFAQALDQANIAVGRPFNPFRGGRSEFEASEGLNPLPRGVAATNVGAGFAPNLQQSLERTSSADLERALGKVSNSADVSSGAAKDLADTLRRQRAAQDRQASSRFIGPIQQVRPRIGGIPGPVVPGPVGPGGPGFVLPPNGFNPRTGGTGFFTLPSITGQDQERSVGATQLRNRSERSRERSRDRREREAEARRTESRRRAAFGRSRAQGGFDNDVQASQRNAAQQLAAAQNRAADSLDDAVREAQRIPRSATSDARRAGRRAANRPINTALRQFAFNGFFAPNNLGNIAGNTAASSATRGLERGRTRRPLGFGNSGNRTNFGISDTFRRGRNFSRGLATSAAGFSRGGNSALAASIVGGLLASRAVGDDGRIDNVNQFAAGNAASAAGTSAFAGSLLGLGSRANLVLAATAAISSFADSINKAKEAAERADFSDILDNLSGVQEKTVDSTSSFSAALSTIGENAEKNARVLNNANATFADTTEENRRGLVRGAAGLRDAFGLRGAFGVRTSGPEFTEQELNALGRAGFLEQQIASLGDFFDGFISDRNRGQLAGTGQTFRRRLIEREQAEISDERQALFQPRVDAINAQTNNAVVALLKGVFRNNPNAANPITDNSTDAEVTATFDFIDSLSRESDKIVGALGADNIQTVANSLGISFTAARARLLENINVQIEENIQKAKSAAAAERLALKLQELSFVIDGSRSRIAEQSFQRARVNDQFQAQTRRDIGQVRFRTDLDNQIGRDFSREFDALTRSNILGDTTNGRSAIVDRARDFGILQNRLVSVINQNAPTQPTTIQDFFRGSGDNRGILDILGLNNPNNPVIEQFLNERGSSDASVLFGKQGREILNEILDADAFKQATEVVSEGLRELGDRTNQLNSLIQSRIDNRINTDVQNASSNAELSSIRNRFSNQIAGIGDILTPQQAAGIRNRRISDITGIQNPNLQNVTQRAQDAARIFVDTFQRERDLVRQLEQPNLSQNQSAALNQQLDQVRETRRTRAAQIKRLEEALKLNANRTEELRAINNRLVEIDRRRNASRGFLERVASADIGEQQAITREFTNFRRLEAGQRLRPQDVLPAIRTVSQFADTISQADFNSGRFDSVFGADINSRQDLDNLIGRILGRQAGSVALSPLTAAAFRTLTQQTQQGPANREEQALRQQARNAQEQQVMATKAMTDLNNTLNNPENLINELKKQIEEIKNTELKVKIEPVTVTGANSLNEDLAKAVVDALQANFDNLLGNNNVPNPGLV